MDVSISNSLVAWLNSATYEEWVKNAEGVYEEIDYIVYLDDKRKKSCVELFKNAVLSENPEKKLTDFPFAKWSLCVSSNDSKVIHSVLQNLNKLFPETKLQDKILSEMLDPPGMLIEAAKEGNIEFIKEMADLGVVDFNVQDAQGRTPLFWAALRAQNEILTVLLKTGADPNIPDEDGDTVLMQAVGRDSNCVKTLIESGKVKINQIDKKGDHALTYACFLGQEEIVKILLDNGADINLQNKHGSTALVDLTLYSITEAHAQILKMLADRLDPESLAMHKEILRLISIAHATSIKGVSHLKAVNENFTRSPIKLEGGVPQYWMQKMCKATGAFLKHYPDLIQKSVLSRLIHMLQHAAFDSSEEILERHQKGLPVLMNINFKGHAISVLILENNFIICNRGRASRQPTEIFQFEPKNLTIEVLDKMRKMTSMDEAAYLDLFFQELPNLLKFKDPILKKSFERACTLPLQTSGNCTWASPELAVLVYFMMNKFLTDFREKTLPSMELNQVIVDEVKSEFDEWSAFNQMYHLERYLGPRHLRHKDPMKLEKAIERRSVYLIDNRLLLSSMQSIIKTMPSSSDQIEDLQHILAKTITFDEQDGELNYAQAKKVMDSLFEPNAEDVVKEFTDRIQKK